jgi:hypothetical protein
VPPFDLDLIDPAPAALEKAMADAVETANLRCRIGLMPIDRAAYRQFVASEFPAAPEGVAIWLAEKGRVDNFPPTPRATMLGVAWYTTPAGRRSVRIAGRRIEPFREHPSNRFGPPWRPWPPLCLLDPDHAVTRAFAGEEPETLVMCGCGAVGPPQKLGWMLGRCGPCHDHLEEHGSPLATGDGPPVLRTTGQLIRAGFLPAGRTVAAVEWIAPREGTRVTVWDRRTGEGRSELPGQAAKKVIAASELASGLALSDDSWVLWIGESGQGSARRMSYLSYGVLSYGVTLAFQGGTAVGMSYDGSVHRRDLTARGDWEQVWPERRHDRGVIYFSLAMNPTGTKAALGMTGCSVELLDWPGGVGPTLHPPEMSEDVQRQRIYALALSPDGKLLAAGAGRSGFVDDPSENWFGRGGGLYLYDAVKGEHLSSFPTPRDDVTAVAFSPDGKLLFYGSTDCSIHVLELSTRKELAVLCGHMGGVNGLTFSPDGQTLASAGGDGALRLWPWRQVLERPVKPAKKKPKR